MALVSQSSVARHRIARSGFTLVEMLVVVAIIAVLAAILIPTAMYALSTTRNARVGIELAEIQKAVEAYKNKMGDYPPSMGEVAAYGNNAQKFRTICEQHFRRCYPNMDLGEKNNFYANIAPLLDQDEAYVFFLARTKNDQRFPFTSSTASINKFYDFEESRLVDNDGDGFPAFLSAYGRGTSYVYLDSRTYTLHTTIAGAAIHGNQAAVQPYASSASGGFMNPTTFQIICAGQDGDFGITRDYATAARAYPSGANFSDGDQDNITNFSEGKRLKDARP